ncbi:hypothetical protein BVRB_1g005890 [Beta vulgaris subsp. vulgaris]|nr:hypothetical protein BVRB_1g005890 [Beta vulgaris subsp. vulgaris]
MEMMMKKSVSVSFLVVMFAIVVLLATNTETTSAARELDPLSRAQIELAEQFVSDRNAHRPLTCGGPGAFCSPFNPCCADYNCYGVCVPKCFPNCYN